MDDTEKNIDTSEVAEPQAVAEQQEPTPIATEPVADETPSAETEVAVVSESETVSSPEDAGSETKKEVSDDSRPPVPVAVSAEASSTAAEQQEPTPIATEPVADETPSAETDVDVVSESETASSPEDAGSETKKEVSDDSRPPVPVTLSAEATSTDSAVEEEDDEEEGLLPQIDPERASLPWYVVHTYSGYELRVKLTLEERIRSKGLIQKFGHIVVPEEKVVELVRGQKKTSKRKFFPGYILVQCDLDEETWHLVKDTPKVTGFVGDSVKPAPLSQAEVDSLLAQMEGGAQRARPSVEFEQGDSVKVVDGPFADFNGTVDEVKPDKGKLRVLISIFGRNTPVELDFIQVEKV